VTIVRCRDHTRRAGRTASRPSFAWRMGDRWDRHQARLSRRWTRLQRLCRRRRAL